MTDQEFNRRRELITKRLVEQIKNFNKKLIIQIFNYIFFILIVLPFIIGSVLYLIGAIFSNAVEATQESMLMGFKNYFWNFIFTNSVFHLAIILILVIVVVLMVMHYYYTSVKFNDDELKLAGYVLAKILQNRAVTYNTLHRGTGI